VSGVTGWLEQGPRRRTPQRVRRLGLLDLLLVVLVCSAVVSRTTVGTLAWWAGHRVRGTDLPLPSLTATFSDGMLAPPTMDVLPAADEALRDDQLPEPYRTALRSALADGLPAATVEALASEPGAPEADVEAVMELVDDRYAAATGDPAAVVESLVVGEELRQRAVARARAAGAASPERFDVHRLYLPNAVRVEADRVVGGTLAVAAVLDLGWPVAARFPITSPFGVRVHPTLKTRRFHNGIDVGVPVGTDVRAPQAGTVDVVGNNPVSGRFVIVDHGRGVRTSYCHLSKAEVARGDEVQAGQLLALSGNTGRSTGPHLHYIVRIGGDEVDPMRFRRPAPGPSGAGPG